MTTPASAALRLARAVVEKSNAWNGRPVGINARETLDYMRPFNRAINAAEAAFREAVNRESRDMIEANRARADHADYMDRMHSGYGEDV